MSHNTWIHRAVRGAVRPLVATPVTPNHLTTLRLASGLGAAGLIAFGPQDLWNWAAGLFLISLFLDRADGELARLGGKTTPWGHKFDLMADGTCNAVIFFALGLGLSSSALGDWALFMGLIAGLSVTAILLIVLRLEAMAGERAGELQGLAGIDPDDGMVVVPVLLWLGLADWLLVAAAIGAPVFALILLNRFWRALDSG
ncbi:MAG: CDP-alcohol phosphatidyltransferase family protein [Pseudomonadota bacterium]